MLDLVQLVTRGFQGNGAGGHSPGQEPKTWQQPITSSVLNSLPSDSEYTSGSEAEPSTPTIQQAEFGLNDHADSDLTGKVTRLDAYPFDCGSTADVYRGELAIGQTTIKVAIKLFRRVHSNPKLLTNVTDRLYNEMRIWQNLNHRNILECLGMCWDIGPSPALISPLCSFGPVMKYLQDRNKSMIEKLGGRDSSRSLVSPRK